VAFLVVADPESPEALESSLMYALLRFDRLRQSASGAKTSALRLILPKGNLRRLHTDWRPLVLAVLS
jgi:hypothetical protein